MNSDYRHIKKSEDKDPKRGIRKLLLFGLLAGLLVTLKFALSFLPNIEVVTPLIIAYTFVFGIQVIIPVYIFVAIETLLYGLNIWTASYLYVWVLLVFGALVIKKLESPIITAAFAGIYGLLFGGLTAIVTLVIGGWSMAVAYWIAGLGFDLVHGGSNFVLTLLLITPLTKVLTYGKIKLEL